MSNRAKVPNKSNKHILVAITALVLLSAAIISFIFLSGGSDQNSTDAGQDIVINKNEISETVKFYSIKSGKQNMEVLAVKASDGSIRTAFNTCQVCNGSPRAYYKQEGEVLVCQNCGNEFEMDMIEQQRGGCNPVPILQENRKDDGTSITISSEYIAQNGELFTANWKTK